MKEKIIFTLLITFVLNNYAQVGIGTTTPNPNVILDIHSTNSGVLLPRVDLSTISSTSMIESTILYNTNETFSYGKGFYYWDGTQWRPIDEKQNLGNLWSSNGNEIDNANGTFMFQDVTPGDASLSFSNRNEQTYMTLYDSKDFSNNPGDPIWTFNSNLGTSFLGTTNNEPLILAQNNQPRFILNKDQILALKRGSNNNPIYSFYDSPKTGISATTNWVDKSVGKNRRLNTSNPSPNLNSTTLDFSVDGSKILTLSEGDILIENSSNFIIRDKSNNPKFKIDTNNGEIDIRNSYLRVAYGNSAPTSGGIDGQLYFCTGSTDTGIYLKVSGTGWVKIGTP
jgi:hypothetical protein